MFLNWSFKYDTIEANVWAPSLWGGDGVWFEEYSLHVTEPCFLKGQ